MNRRALGAALDAVAVGLLLAAALATWPHGVVGGVAPPEGAPAWSTAQDQLLDGPDAGRWAWQAQALLEGDRGHLDPHRMPTWTLITAAVALLGGLSVPLAGHLTNHLFRVALGPVVYGLARRLGLDRAASLAAGILTVGAPAVLFPSRRFGIDPAVTFFWPAGLLAVSVLARLRWGGMLAGLVAALVCAAHFTTLPAPVPLFVALMVATAPARRPRATLGFVAGLVAGLVAIFSILPPMPPRLLWLSVAEGIAPRYQGPPSVDERPWARALTVLTDGMSTAAGDVGLWLQMHVGSLAVPGSVLALIVVLGALGVGLLPRPEPLAPWTRLVPRPVRLEVEAVGRGLPVAIAPLLVLAPLPVLFVAHAPGRYMNNLLPVAAVLIARGVAVLAGSFDHLARRAWARWPGGIQGAGALGYALLMTSGHLPDLAPLPPPEQDVATLRGAQAIRAAFPEARDVATLIPELGASIGAFACPEPRICPDGDDEAAFRRCLRMLFEECAGAGDIPYVVAERRPQDERTVERAAMDAWVSARWPVVGRAEDPTLDVRVVAIPRADAAAP